MRVPGPGWPGAGRQQDHPERDLPGCGPAVRAAAKTYWDALDATGRDALIQQTLDLFPGVRLGLTLDGLRTMLARYAAIDAAVQQAGTGDAEYARIDGFLSKSGKLFLNDPNTTSGMMPSSFFFHPSATLLK